jgi:hypothetical protein
MNGCPFVINYIALLPEGVLMPTITLYPSQWKMIRGVIAGVLLTALFVAILFYHDQWKVAIQWWLIAYPGIPIAAGATLYWLTRLVRRRPSVQVTPDGIIDTSSGVGVGLIRWNEIARLGLKTTRFQGSPSYYLTITPRDMKAILARQASPLTKLYDSIGGEIEIGQVYLPVTVSQLLNQIEAYYHTYVAAGQPGAITFDHTVKTKSKT